MLDQIMDLVKGQVTKSVAGISGIPDDKKAATVDTTVHSLLDGLKKTATSGGISSLTSMFGAGGKSSGSGLESGVVSALTSKVGLSPAIAQKIATSVVPLVMSLMKKRVADDNEPGFNLDSIVGGLTGKGSSGGIMNMIGGIFGKK